MLKIILDIIMDLMYRSDLYVWYTTIINQNLNAEHKWP